MYLVAALVLRLALSTRKYASARMLRAATQVKVSVGSVCGLTLPPHMQVSPSAIAMRGAVPTGMAADLRARRDEHLAFQSSVEESGVATPVVDTSKRHWIDAQKRGVRAV